MDINEILAIVLPFVSYLASGIVILIKVIGAANKAAKEQKKTSEDTSNQVSTLEDQLKISNQETAALRKEVKRLANKVDKIMEE